MKVIKKEERVVSVDLEVDTRRKDLALAEDNRRLLDEKGIIAVDVMGSVASARPRSYSRWRNVSAANGAWLPSPAT